MIRLNTNVWKEFTCEYTFCISKSPGCCIRYCEQKESSRFLRKNTIDSIYLLYLMNWWTRFTIDELDANNVINERYFCNWSHLWTAINYKPDFRLMNRISSLSRKKCIINHIFTNEIYDVISKYFTFWRGL